MGLQIILENLFSGSDKFFTRNFINKHCNVVPTGFILFCVSSAEQHRANLTSKKYSLHWVLGPASVRGDEVAKPKRGSLNQVDFSLVQQPQRQWWCHIYFRINMLGIEPISSRTKTFESHILDINVEHWIIQVFAKKKRVQIWSRYVY